jgi:hypothetical protein
VSSSDRDTTVRRPVTALPFRLHASVTCPPAAELARSLAWELGDFDADRAERNLTALAAAILAETERDPAAQLAALGEAVTNMALCARTDGGPEELLIDKALERGHGHPVLIAIVLQEIGRRAGLPVGIVGGENGHHFVAHQRLADARVLDPRTGRLTDADALGVLRWRCGHQIAAGLLDLLEPRYERIGDLTRALHVARLRTTLPFEDMAEGEQRLRRIAARLN